MAETVSRHRIEGLTDGVYAVALTLLVLDLKLPGAANPMGDAALRDHLAELLPSLLTWVISFLFLTLFWFGHLRLLHRLKAVDTPLLVLCLLHLALVALAPFAVSIYGGNPLVMTAQLIYDLMLGALAATLLAMLEYVVRHPGLQAEPFPPGRVLAVRIRYGALLGCAGLSALGAQVRPEWFGIPFCGIFFAGLLARRMERRLQAMA